MIKSLFLRSGLVACLILPSIMRASTVEERLEQLEARISAMAEENAALKKQLGYDASGKTSAALVTAIGKEPKLSVGGFLHLNGEFGDAADSRFPANDRFLLRKARLGVKGSLTDTVDFFLQADLGTNSLSDKNADYRLQAADVFVLWKAYSAANVTIGQFKTPFGYEWLVPDTKTISIERSLASDKLMLNRQAGAMVSGVFFNKRLTYAAAITNGNPANNSFNDNEQFAYIGRVAGTVFDNKTTRISVGASGFNTRDVGFERTGKAVDAQVSFAGADLTAELLDTTFNPDTGADYDARGWSVMGAYFFVPKRWQAFVRYETYDPSNLLGANETDLRTIGLNYFVSGDDLKLSLNYLIGSPPGAPKHQDRLIARVQVVF